MRRIILLLGIVFFIAGSALSYSGLQTGQMKIEEEVQSGPQIKINTPVLDFGVLEPGMTESRRLEITNVGQGTLHWKAVHGRKGEKLPFYISLFNVDAKGTGHYTVPSAYREAVELTGVWTEKNGWPVLPPQGVIRFNFSGTGVIVHYWRMPEGGRFSFLCDQYWLGEVDTQAEKQERTWIHCVEHLPFGRHTLTLVGEKGYTILAGFEVTGREVQWAPKQVRFIPDNGVTTKEIDYVTVTVDPQNSPSGLYGHVISFRSNGGNVDVHLSWEVKNEGSLKVLDVFRYVSPKEGYFFTTNPQEDEKIIRRGGYRKEGICFRLFCHGTPGTVEFYRWYNPSRDSFFYSYNKQEVEKLDRGFILEGPVGNIATTRLRNTRELYRWYHPKMGFYFYTPLVKDPSLPKGYRFDGIAGYIPY
ncbi:MAG: hypothetical protein N2572_09025 [Syntrophales bacterium]|nr:hypothetical protein [Syntrophales bacterium]